MKKIIYYGILIVLAVVFCYSGYRIFQYAAAKNESVKITEQAAEYVVPSKEEEQPPEVDFAALQQLNPDVVAWIYGSNTTLNYPVVQSSDNDYYLYRLLDGSSNENGTIFMDHRCKPDFSQSNTLIYGHNMRSGNMFGCLTDYKDPEYYAEHPTLFLMTPDAKYRVELLAGCVTDTTAEALTVNLTGAKVRECMEQSTFTTQAVYSPEYSIVTLVTCSYEFDDARYILLGQLIPVE